VVAHWDPVPLLDFEVDLLYQDTHQSTPGNWGPGIIVSNGVVTSPAAFKSESAGFAGRVEITRSW
jgi:hypothetical protein